MVSLHAKTLAPRTTVDDAANKNCSAAAPALLRYPKRLFHISRLRSIGMNGCRAAHVHSFLVHLVYIEAGKHAIIAWWQIWESKMAFDIGQDLQNAPQRSPGVLRCRPKK